MSDQPTTVDERFAFLEHHLIDLEGDLEKTLNSVLALGEQMTDQAAVLKGLMFVIEAAMSMNKILNQRVLALEERARGMSFEDMVSGKELTPLGPTEEHIEVLNKINAGLEQLNAEMDKTTNA